jgi:predicted nucleic acid-binding protein
MSLLVVDASVVLKWFVPEEDSEAALRLLEREQRFLTPGHLLAETTNAIWKRVRMRHFSIATGYDVIEKIRRTAVTFDVVSCPDLAVGAYKLAIAYRRSVYDAMYLALALQRNTRLVTADRRLYNAVSAAPEIAPHIQSLADY